MSNQENLNPTQANSMDDIFKSPDLESIDPTKLVEEFENRPSNIPPPENKPPAVTKKFEPKVNRAAASQTTTDISSQDTVTEARIKAMEEEIKKLREGQNGVKIGKAPSKPAPLDFTKLTENDVYDLDVPIEAIDHSIPNWLTADLKDKNYAARWIHKTPRRIGPMMAQGWTYVVPEDLANLTELKETIDENGHFRYDDVILCKIPKAKYFGQLRRNHERAMMQVNPKFHHQRSKKAVEGALQNAPQTGKPGRHYNEYVSEGKLEVYVPGEK